MNIDRFFGKTFVGFSILVFFAFSTSQAQDQYEFQDIKRLATTSVKNQGHTGTCWTFATLSMLESELLRMEKSSVNLSEMFIVRNSYVDRAELFVRFHGNLNFGPGAQAWDVINVLKEDGIVPQNVYPGLKANPDVHSHSEMDRVLNGYMESVIENKNGELTPVWDDGLNGILDAYLGTSPKNFTFRDHSFTPQTFLNDLGLDLANYIPLTSFKDHPYYSSYVFESPDNWSMESIYNVPLDDFIEIIDHSIMQGYTLAWAADVSNPGFSHSRGLAVVPKKDWDEMDDSEKESVFSHPVEQRNINETMRLKAFHSYGTTDDHLMHIVGKATDQDGNPYYIVKNSWGTENPYNGYLYVSETYIKYRTTSIMINKQALKANIAEQLGL